MVNAPNGSRAISSNLLAVYAKVSRVFLVYMQTADWFKSSNIMNDHLQREQIYFHYLRV